MYLAPYAEDCFFVEKETVIETVPEWSELLDESEVEFDVEVEEIPAEILDYLQTPIHITPDYITINFNRWNPDYASHTSSTIPDSLKLVGSDLAFKKLYEFFETLESISDQDIDPIEIFHWGDSQIEGDRISGVLRSSWQKTWGGSGPGLIPGVQPIPALSIRQEIDGNWSRHTRFGELDSTIEHNAYGPMVAFCRVDGDANITLKPHPSGFKLNKVWPRIKINIGAAPLGGNITIKGSTNPYRAFSIRPASSSMHQEILVNLEEGENELNVGFEGYKLEVTGIELGSSNGVQLHNIPMRGSAGMIFTKLDSKHLKRSLENRRVGLMVLQFGGNVVPYIKDTIAAKRYGKRFAKQLSYLKQLKPNSSIIVIGPADMGGDTESTIYPMLGAVINSLEAASIEEDCLFWNTYKVMAEAGSMKRWSEAEPRLASPDLIHFTPKGARIIGERIDLALRAEYKSWLEWKR